MKFFVLFILGAAAIIELELAAAADGELECYWCFGYLYNRTEVKNNNTKACTLDSFNKDEVAHFSNSTEDGYVLACVTLSVRVEGWNEDKPVTARGAYKHKIRERPANINVLDAGLFDDDVVDLITKAHPDHPVHIGVEFCFEDLCNDITYHRSSASTVSVSGAFFLLLPAVALRYSM